MTLAGDHAGMAPAGGPPDAQHLRCPGQRPGAFRAIRREDLLALGMEEIVPHRPDLCATGDALEFLGLIGEAPRTDIGEGPERE
jgi:hypothetical protein